MFFSYLLNFLISWCVKSIWFKISVKGQKYWKEYKPLSFSEYSCTFVKGGGIGGTKQNIGNKPNPQTLVISFKVNL